MGRIVAVANQKGGVGKTTTAVNLTASLASLGRKVLLLDIDPQGNATMGCGVNKHELKRSSCDVLLGESKLHKAIVRSPNAEFDVLPANSDLTAAEVGLMNAPLKEKRLNLALEGVEEHYDFVIIDCPPSLNMLTLNALVAAHSVLIPIQCEYYALEGLSSLINTIRQIQASRNPALKIEGILRTMHDPRNRLTNDVSAQLLHYFSNKVFTTIIPRNVRLAEAPSHGLPILLYDDKSRGAISYLELAREFLRRNEAPINASA
ncbi:MAG: ParA family protein [Gammaproteobacteria bacterium]|nr:ParA family protein [Gammaproteobacteria bacterium]